MYANVGKIALTVFIMKEKQRRCERRRQTCMVLSVFLCLCDSMMMTMIMVTSAAAHHNHHHIIFYRDDDSTIPPRHKVGMPYSLTVSASLSGMTVT